MIPQNILEPKGCGNIRENGKLICGNSYFNPISCQDNYIWLCPSCKSSRKAVIKALIDEKKEESKVLEEWLYNITKSTNHSPQKLYNKIEELTQEINTLEGLE